MLISFFGMAVTNVLVEPLSQSDTNIANSKLLRAYTKQARPMGRESWTAARSLGPCLAGAALQEKAAPHGGSRCAHSSCSVSLLRSVAGTVRSISLWMHMLEFVCKTSTVILILQWLLASKGSGKLAQRHMYIALSALAAQQC